MELGIDRTAPLHEGLWARVRPKSPETGTALFDDVRQVCTVVDDFEVTVRNLVEHLGVGPFRCWHFRPPHLHRTTYRGQEASYSMRLAITWLDDMQWEVITPVDGPSLYRDHLHKHGPGVQHLLMSTGSVPFASAVELLRRRGHPFGQTAQLNAQPQIGRFSVPRLPNRLASPLCLRFGYIDAEATLRTNIELTRYPMGFSERFSLRSGRAEFCVPEGNHRFERPLPNRRVAGVAKIVIVTGDLEATARAYLDVVGVGPWQVFDIEGDFRARVARATIGQAMLELVEPIQGASPYQDALDARGECVASLGVLASGDRDALCRDLVDLGCEVKLDRALVGDEATTWLATSKLFGTDLEILPSDGAALRARWKAQEPDRVIRS